MVTVRDDIKCHPRVAKEGQEIESKICRKEKDGQEGCEEKEGEEVEALTASDSLYTLL